MREKPWAMSLEMKRRRMDEQPSTETKGPRLSTVTPPLSGEIYRSLGRKFAVAPVRSSTDGRDPVQAGSAAAVAEPNEISGHVRNLPIALPAAGLQPYPGTAVPVPKRA
jgi:hypothetical protein